jgi:predicted secreted protein
MRARNLLVAVAATAALAASAACGSGGTVTPVVPHVPEDLPRGIVVTHTAGSAKIKAGDRLVVDFGDVNPSVGDSWYLVTPPDATVLVDQGEHTDSDCDQPGCGGHLTWLFGATAPGTTKLVFQYCFRSHPKACQGPFSESGVVRQPVPLTVTVT